MYMERRPDCWVAFIARFKALRYGHPRSVQADLMIPRVLIFGFELLNL